MRPLTDAEERACVEAQFKAATFSYYAAALRPSLLMLETMPYETRTEGEIRREIKRLTETLNYLANRRKERSNDRAA